MRGEFLAIRRTKLSRVVKKFFDLRIKIGESASRDLVRELEKLNRDMVILDIGANIGQFGLDMRLSGFRGAIYSFEPVNSAYKHLVRTAKRFQPWHTYNYAIGSQAGESEIFISGNRSLSSSMLPMSDLHLSNCPESAYINKQKTHVSTISAEIRRLQLSPSQIILKIDVQGSEYEVIQGGRDLFEEIPLCLIELSLTPMYNGEKSLEEMIAVLTDLNHKVINIHRGFIGKSGELLQIDILTRRIGK